MVLPLLNNAFCYLSVWALEPAGKRAHSLARGLRLGGHGDVVRKKRAGDPISRETAKLRMKGTLYVPEGLDHMVVP